jgi:acetyl esterase
MPLDPGLAGMLSVLEQMNMMGFAASTPAQARAGFRAMTCDIRPQELVIGVGEVTDGELPGPAGPLAIRTYRPEPARSEPAQSGEGIPTILFIHGGGWVIGDLDTHDNQARRLCREVGAVVVSLDYRLAPEAPFPAAVEDAWAALSWVGEHVDELGGDRARIAVAGDSAGGTLSAVVAARSRDRGGPELAAQLLIYPGADFSATDPATYPSRVENAEGKLLTAKDMAWFAAQYIGPVFEGLDLAHPDLSPIRAADLKGLAPAIVVTAEFDPLRDEGEAYARALEQAGTPVTLVRMDGMIHGFFDLGPVSPGVETAVSRTCALLRNALYR